MSDWRAEARKRCEAATTDWCLSENLPHCVKNSRGSVIAMFSGMDYETIPNATFAACARFDLPRALDELDAAEKRIAELEGELRAVDNRLARRPALADCKTRADAVEFACSTAGAATSDVIRLKRDVETLHGENSALKARIAELEAELRHEREKIHLEWSDRSGEYHPRNFWEAVLACSLDHSYDRTSDGVPYGMPDEYRAVFAPIVAKHLSAVNPDWADNTVYMTDEQHDAFAAELKAANEIGPLPSAPAEENP